MDINQQIKEHYEYCKRTYENSLFCDLYEISIHQAAEIAKYKWEDEQFKWLQEQVSICATENKTLSRQLEIAIKALEHYTGDEVYCGRCGGMTVDKEHGEVARSAISEIQEVSKP